MTRQESCFIAVFLVVDKIGGVLKFWKVSPSVPLRPIAFPSKQIFHAMICGVVFVGFDIVRISVNEY